MEYKKISIITPHLNQGYFLEKMIQSLISQNYPDIEFIIIDGGSKDHSIDIIKKYEKHITYWISEKDNGQSDAINKGFALATGDIINWISSDDFLYPQSLFLINEIFQKERPDILVGATLLSNTITKKNTILYPERKNYIYQIPIRMPFPQPSTFFSKQFLDNNNYVVETLNYAMDMELLTRVYFSVLLPKVFFTDKILSVYNIHSASKTYSMPLEFFEEWKTVFHSFCRAMNFYHNLICLETLELHSSYDIEKICFSFPDSVKNKYTTDEKHFLAYFLKYQLFYFIEKKKDENALKILNYFWNNLRTYFIKWNLFRFYIKILKNKIV